MPEQARVERIFTTWLTSADRVDHAVTDEQFHDNRPEPEAVCGDVILLAAMETPPGPHCRRCRAFLRARESLSTMGQRLDMRRHRRRSWLARILHADSEIPPAPGQRPAEVDT